MELSFLATGIGLLTWPGRTRVVILFGGRSAEHEVSILSARNVLAALDRTRFEPVLIGIDKQGRWRAQSEKMLAGATGDPRLLKLEDDAPTVALASTPSSITQLLGSDDVIFPVLHGTYGEDGTVQGLLELADVAYVGAGVLGSAIGMDKDVAKRLLRDAGIPVVDFRVVTATDLREDPRIAAGHADALGYPVFVKPVNAGSSVGVSKVNDPSALEPALRAALAFDRKVMLERGVDAREIEVAVLGNDRPAASVPGEIIVHHRDGFYSYDAKYVDADGAAWQIPAEFAERPHGARAGARGRDVPHARARGHGARRFLRRTNDVADLRQRGEHDPWLHRDLDVPEDVGSEWALRERPRHTAHQSRDRTT